MERKNIIFVTGTDTGIGKTTVMSILYAHFLSTGVNVRAMKPIETGCLPSEQGELQALDGEILRSVSARFGAETPQDAASDDTVLYRFIHPVAPSVAAKADGASIDKAELAYRIEEQVDNVDLLLVEGAGGLLVPIGDDYTFADLVSDVGMSVLVVVGSKLGAINHAALTFEVLRARDLPTIGYVLNNLFHSEPNAAAQSAGDVIQALQTNRELLRQVGSEYGMEELCYLPWLENVSDLSVVEKLSADVEVKKLADAIKGHAFQTSANRDTGRMM